MEHFIQRWDVFKEADQATAREDDYLAIVLIKNLYSLFPYNLFLFGLVWFGFFCHHHGSLFEHDLPQLIICFLSLCNNKWLLLPWFLSNCSAFNHLIV